MSELRLIRSQVRVLKAHDQHEEASPLSPAELIASVWELTKEIYSIAGDFDAESRLQRDVVSVTRKRG